MGGSVTHAGGRTSTYYRSAHGIIFVYDLCNSETFAHIRNWLIEAETHANKLAHKLLVGNKADKHDERQVTLEEGQVGELPIDLTNPSVSCSFLWWE